MYIRHTTFQTIFVINCMYKPQYSYNKCRRTKSNIQHIITITQETNSKKNPKKYSSFGIYIYLYIYKYIVVSNCVSSVLYMIYTILYVTPLILRYTFSLYQHHKLCKLCSLFATAMDAFVWICISGVTTSYGRYIKEPICIRHLEWTTGTNYARLQYKIK